MSYFQNFPVISYKFGDEPTANAFQNISAYVDIIDRIKDDTVYYENYFIQSKERADWLSYKLYEDPRFSWTFYIMNDHIRRQGWPVDYSGVTAKAKADYPNKTLVIRELFFDKFLKGSTVTGQSSAATGKVLRRNLDLGQIVVESTNEYAFTPGELLNDASDQQVTLFSVSDEYLSAHHYENAEKETIDFDPTVGPGMVLTEITYLDRMVAENETLKSIKVIKRNVINDLEIAYQEALAG